MKNQTNAAEIPGVSCTASSTRMAKTCDKAYDGIESDGSNTAWAVNPVGDNVGQWIEITFPEEMLVTGVDLFHRCGYGDACSDFRVDFSDGSFQDVC